MLELARMVGWDINLQFRHHIVTANVLSTAFICGFVLLLPLPDMPVSLASFFIFIDPALIGLSFVGGIMLMEKAARVHSALGVTPSPPWVYLASRIITLTVTGSLSGLAVAICAYGQQFNIAMMVWALLVSNMVAVLIGFICAARAKSMNDLMIRLLYLSTVLFAPLLPHFGVTPDWAAAPMAIIPSASMLALLDMGGAAQPDLAAAALHSAYLFAWVAGAWAWSLREYRDHVLSEGR